jgi:putative iron-dependent peroxidase
VSGDTPQAGIFALGTSSHAFLELELLAGAEARELVKALAGLREPRMTIGGVNLVTGFRPELWREGLGAGAPPELSGFTEPILGSEGFVMPATQRDAFLWLSGSAYDIIFEEARAAISSLEGIASVASEVSSWPYQHDRDLTGFIDGSENPSLAEAPEVTIIQPGVPGAGGSVLLLQQWAHDARAWEALSDERQEAVIGRTKRDSIELEDKPAGSHVARTDQDELGKIFRRNMPYGTVTDHGTMFVGFAASQQPLQRMLESMAGLVGPRDELTRYTTPLTGSYYFVPSLRALSEYAPQGDS